MVRRRPATRLRWCGSRRGGACLGHAVFVKNLANKIFHTATARRASRRTKILAFPKGGDIRRGGGFIVVAHTTIGSETMFEARCFLKRPSLRLRSGGDGGGFSARGAIKAFDGQRCLGCARFARAVGQGPFRRMAPKRTAAQVGIVVTAF